MILDFIKDIETHTYRRRLGNRIINFKMDVESPKYVHTYVRYGLWVGHDRPVGRCRVGQVGSGKG